MTFPARIRFFSHIIIVLFLSILAAALFTGCATNSIVRRAEQVQAIGKSTFDAALRIDNANRGFYRTNAPAFHNLCEWLREPMPVITYGTNNTLPRASAMLWNLHQTKLLYKASLVTSNDLSDMSATVEAALWQAQRHLATNTLTSKTP